MKNEMEMLLLMALSGAKAARSVPESPYGADTRNECSESASADFHELRQGFNAPTRRRVQDVGGKIGFAPW